MKVRHSLLALGLAALASPAFAQNYADVYNLTASGDIVLTSGSVDVDGKVSIASKSAAVVDQRQDTVSNLSAGDGDHASRLTDNALQGAQGNIGVNVSAGVGNAQANDAALSAVDGARVFASAMSFSNQTSTANIAGTFSPDTFYSAQLDGNALQGAKGNIGVNVAAGVGNAQGNGMTGSVNTSGRYALASATGDQKSVANVLLAFNDLDTFATFGGNALQGAQGNIGVNVAAGIGNLQQNSLSIASAVGP